MRTLGIILISIGIALILFIAYTFLREKNKVISPIPEDTGIKVIFVTPSK
jgi:glycopeptide antibiotics resistance protein